MTTSFKNSSSPSTHNLIKLFTSKEYEDLYSIPEFNEEERSYFFTFSSSDKELLSSFRRIEDKIYFLLSLGYFRAKYCLISFSFNSTVEDRHYIMNTYFKEYKTPQHLPPDKQQIYIQNKVLAHEKSIRWTTELQKDLDPLLSDLIKRHPKARPLTKAFLQHLKKKRVALPSYSTLQRLITKAFSLEKKRLFDSYQNTINPEDQLLIDGLLKQEENLYSIAMIKQDVKDFNYAELQKEIKKHKILKPIFYASLEILKRTELPKKTIEYYGSLVNFYSVYKLNRMPKKQAHWYLLCYSFSRASLSE